MNINENNNQSKFVKTTVLISAVILLILIVSTVIGVKTWPQRTINKIEALIEDQNYIIAEKLIESYENKMEDVDLDDEKEICNYNIAKDLLLQGNTEDARYRLKLLGDYKDTKALLKECDYVDANAMMGNDEYEQAYTVFLGLAKYKDSSQKLLEARYAIALRTYEEGDIARAFEMFAYLDDYDDAKEQADVIAMEVTGADFIKEAYNILEGMNIEQMGKIAELTEVRATLPANVVAVGAHHTVGLQGDGEVVAIGSDEMGQCSVSKWSDIIAVDAGLYHTVGLTSDGKVLAAGSNEHGQCDVADWEDVVSIAAGAYNTYALLKDGTVVSTGFSNENIFDELKNIRKIGAGSYAAACINADGTILATHPSLFVRDTGAIDVDVNTGYIVALMPDGTISASIDNTKDWDDIIAISAGSNVVLGIKTDGSVEAYFFSERDEVNLGKYTNVVAIAAGGSHSAILLSDGRVVTFGNNEHGECDAKSWNLLNKDE